jgi:endonuclease/exonuclease/phosphatase family metal-dependent hydrolase
MIFLRFLKKILSAISLLCGLSLLLGILCVYINPGTITFPAFFGLAFPVIYVLNVIMAGLALANKKKWVIFHIVLLLAGLFRLTDIINFIPSSAGNKGNSIRILSYNVRGFNRYNWIKDNSVQEKIERLIRREDPDIIYFQEFHLPGKNDLRSIRDFSSRIGLKHYIFNNYDASNDISGLVIFSRYPLRSVKRENFHDEIFGGNGVISADVDINNQPYRLINIHLESIRFERPDYEYAQDPTSEKSQFKIAGMRILERFNKAYHLRGDQVKKVVQEIEESKYPVILAGDANDPPVSYSYYNLSRKLEDSFHKGGMGTGGTYAGRLPSFRIDYIMHSKELLTLNHKVIHEDLSDHYPIITNIALSN